MKVSSIRSAAKFRQTVLVIDDQPTVLDIHVAVLKSLKMNLKIYTMTDPIEAIKWMINKQVDLIITDFSMHNMNGMEFVQIIKNSGGDMLIPIIVVTVLKNQKVLHELLSAGVSACLQKPVDAQELARTSRLLLNKSDRQYSQSLLG